jgi:hypothetical protein
MALEVDHEAWCTFLLAATGRSSEEIAEYFMSWCHFATACAPYKDLPNPLKKKHYAEKVLEYGMPMLLIYAGSRSGRTLALEVEERLTDIVAILEGRFRESPPNVNPQDPYNKTVPARLVDIRKAFQELHYVINYLVSYFDPAHVMYSEVDTFV